MIEELVGQILSEMDRKKLFSSKAKRGEAEAVLRDVLGRIMMHRAPILPKDPDPQLTPYQIPLTAEPRRETLNPHRAQ